MRFGHLFPISFLLAAGCQGFDDLDLTEPPDGSHCPANAPDWCDSSCVDLASDAQSCGACGAPCDVPRGASSVVCANGECRVEACAENLDDCDEKVENGCEANLRTSAQHCGACGHACATECIAGTCNDPIEVSAGPSYTCAIRASGSLWCWGADTWGNLGVGEAEMVLSPRKVELPGPVAAVSTGRLENNMHTCALLAEGAVYCWGSNAYGQIGAQGIMGSPSPVLVDLPPSMSVAAGGVHTCALSKAQQLRCWGANDSGQLGAGMGVGATPKPTVVLVNADDVAAGARHTCGRVLDGGLWCWGANGSGQLGNGALTAEYQPVKIPAAAGSLELGLGTSHTCARFPDGTVRCWGEGADGQLGLGNTDDALTPQAIGGLFEIVRLGIGFDSSAAIRAGTSEAWAWGDNDSAQLGFGAAMPTLLPAKTGLGAVERVSLGERHGCAIVRSGALACWGANESGQLGAGDTTPRSTPAVVVFPSEAP